MHSANVGNLRIVDTHCHLWRIELLRKVWQPPEVIFRTFEAKDLTEDCEPSGVTQCVLIEAGMESEDNDALEQFANSSPLIAGVVPFMDLRKADLDKQIDAWQRKPKFCGVRMRFEGNSDPDAMTCGAAIEGFQKLAARGITFEFLVTTKDLPNILKVYERVPDLVGVIEHLGKPDLRHGTDWKEWSQRMGELASHTKAICKLSLGPRGEDMEEIYAHQGEGWALDKVKPYIQLLLEHFGPQRLMWGSDWPLLRLEASYDDSLETVRAAFGPIDREAEAQILRHTAVKTYGLPVV